MAIKIAALPNKWLILIVIIGTSLLSSLVVVFALAHYPVGYKLLPITHAIDQWQVFSFGGVLITILSLVTAFFMLILAIDAFAVNKTVNVNADRIEKNLTILEDIEPKIANLYEKTGQFKVHFNLIEIFLEEVNEANNSNENILTFLENVRVQLKLPNKFDLDLNDIRLSFGIRRMRYEAIVALLSENPNPDQQVRLESAIPELINQAENNDDQRSKNLLEKLAARGFYTPG